MKKVFYVISDCGGWHTDRQSAKDCADPHCLGQVLFREVLSNDKEEK